MFVFSLPFIDMAVKLCENGNKVNGTHPDMNGSKNGQPEIEISDLLELIKNGNLTFDIPKDGSFENRNIGLVGILKFIFNVARGQVRKFSFLLHNKFFEFIYLF